MTLARYVLIALGLWPFAFLIDVYIADRDRSGLDIRGNRLPAAPTSKKTTRAAWAGD